MKRMGKFMVGLGLMGGLLLLAIPVQAEEGTQVEAWVDEEDGPRELIGHFFLPSSLLNTPFAVSEVKAGTAFAYAAYEPSAGVLASSLLLPSKLELAYLRPTFDMQFGLPAGFRLGATLESTVLSGVSTDAAFAFGAAVVVSGGGNLDWMFLKYKAIALSIGTHVSYDTSMNLSPRGALERSLQSLSLDVTNLYSSVSNTVVTPRFSMGLGAGSALGFLTTMDYRININEESGVSSTTENFRFGVGMSLDFEPNLNIPLGMLVGYMHSSPSSDYAPEVNSLETSIYYTGKEDVRVGFAGRFEFEETADGSSLEIYGILANLTAYF